jgi:hypothetical protein
MWPADGRGEAARLRDLRTDCRDRVFTRFFADEQSDLNGLHENIMGALERAVDFIAVMHSRGEVVIPGRNTSLLTRASVWVEQEIAIAEAGR